MKDLILLKIGGSVITEKDRNTTARADVIERIAKEIASAKRKKDFKLILVNGAGSFGHIPVKEYNLRNGISNEKTKFGFTMVHKYVEDLNRMVWDSLRERGLSSLPLHPASFIVHENKKISKFDTEIIENLISLNIIPLLYGDVVVDRKSGCSIISGDDIVPYLARKFGAKRILMGTNTDGIYDKDPNIFSDAKLIPEITEENYKEILNGLSGSAKTDVTGGMREKIRKLIEGVRGTECIIYNAEKEGLTEKALLGNHVGTRIVIS